MTRDSESETMIFLRVCPRPQVGGVSHMILVIEVTDEDKTSD